MAHSGARRPTRRTVLGVFPAHATPTGRDERSLLGAHLLAALGKSMLPLDTLSYKPQCVVCQAREDALHVCVLTPVSDEGSRCEVPTDTDHSCGGRTDRRRCRRHRHGVRPRALRLGGSTRPGGPVRGHARTEPLRASCGGRARRRPAGRLRRRRLGRHPRPLRRHSGQRLRQRLDGLVPAGQPGPRQRLRRRPADRARRHRGLPRRADAGHAPRGHGGDEQRVRQRQCHPVPGRSPGRDRGHGRRVRRAPGPLCVREPPRGVDAERAGRPHGRHLGGPLLRRCRLDRRLGSPDRRVRAGDGRERDDDPAHR